MIVSEPFAVAYGLDALVHTMVIDIGAGTTDFCVMRGRYPTDDDQRSLTAAGDSIDAQLQKLIQTRYPTASFTIFMVREWKEKYSFVGEAPEPVIVTVPVNGVPTRIDITAEMRAACESIVPPIVETMLDLLSTRRTRIPGTRSQEHHSLRRRRADSQSRPDAGAGAGKSRRRQGQGDRGSGVRWLGRRLAIAKDAQDSDWDRLVS